VERIVTAFKRLTDTEAGTLTRAELLDRVEAEQAYWFRKRNMTSADREAEREFSRIMHAYLSPEAAVRAALDTVRGYRSDYWETRPGDQSQPDPGGGLTLDSNQRAGLAYGLRLAAETESGEDDE
jgi:hypothetical protein